MEKRFYIISYDLKVPGRDYTSLYSVIKDNYDWQHPLESTWLVYSSQDVNSIYNVIKPNMDNNDLLFICELKIQNRQGWMSKKCWEWINSKPLL